MFVQHGQPLRFGANGRQGLRLVPGRLELEVVTVGENGAAEQDLLVHDETNPALASLLAGLRPPRFPMAIGVLYCDPAPSYNGLVEEQLQAAGNDRDLNALLRRGRTWSVAG